MDVRVDKTVRPDSERTNIASLAGFLPRISIDAFLLSEKDRNAMVSIASDRRMSKATVTIHEGGLLKAIDYYAASKTPNLIIVEVDVDYDSLEDTLDQLAVNCPPTTSIVVIGGFNDIKIYRALMEKGVNEYLVSPVSDLELMKSITSVFTREKKQTLGRISAFIGTRGGSGSSTIAQNVAFILAEDPSANVLLIDVDYPFGNVALNLNIDNNHDVSELLNKQDIIDDGFLDRISVRYGKNLRVIGAATSFDQKIEVGKGFVGRVVDAIQEGACHAIIDLPTSWSERETEFLKAADDIILTATLDLSSMKNAKQIAEYCSRTRPNDVDPLLILNQINTPKRPEIKRNDFASAVGLTPAVAIPFDAGAFGKAANNGQTLYEISPKNPSSKAMVDIANYLINKKGESSPDKPKILALWERLIKRK